jgi:hypothetical protein
MLPVATPLTVQHFGGRKTREDFHPERFGLLAEPAHDIGQRNDVIAMVLEAGRQQPVRCLVTLALGQEQKAVFAHLREQGRAALFPVGEQLVHGDRVHDGARQDMGADFAAFFEHADRDITALFGCQLLEPDRGRQPGRAAADDHDIVFHRFARAVLFRYAHSLLSPSLLALGSRMGEIGVRRNSHFPNRRLTICEAARTAADFNGPESDRCRAGGSARPAATA